MRAPTRRVARGASPRAKYPPGRMPPADPPIPANARRAPAGGHARAAAGPTACAPSSSPPRRTSRRRRRWATLTFFPDRTWHGYTYIPVSGDDRERQPALRLRPLRRRHRRARPGRLHRLRRLHRGDRRAQPATGSSTSATRSSAAGAASDGAVASMTLVWGRALIERRRGRDRRARRASPSTSARSSTTASRCWPPTTTPDGLLEVRLYDERRRRARARVALRPTSELTSRLTAPS